MNAQIRTRRRTELIEWESVKKEKWGLGAPAIRPLEELPYPIWLKAQMKSGGCNKRQS